MSYWRTTSNINFICSENHRHSSSLHVVLVQHRGVFLSGLHKVPCFVGKGTANTSHQISYLQVPFRKPGQDGSSPYCTHVGVAEPCWFVTFPSVFPEAVAPVLGVFALPPVKGTWCRHRLFTVWVPVYFWSREAPSLIRSWIRLGSSWAHNVPVLAHEWGLTRVNDDLFAILGAVSEHVCVQAEVGCYVLDASTCLRPLLRRQRGEKNKLIFPS